ncbi:hypothetical protein MKX01_018531 [Papaver californicum]|nr:hypothetical protein MKX01_018531 [Papaver californicum]
MASLSSLTFIYSTASTMSLSATHSSSQGKTQISVVRKPKHIHLRAIRCIANNDNQEKKETSSNNFMDRRNMLLAPPDLSKYGPANLLDGATPMNCCPPTNTEIVDFQVPSETTLRIRPADHLVGEAYIAKYNKAYELMKALYDDDPRIFKQQDNVQCAYCDGAYDQYLSGFPKMDIQVHNSWLFFPFHRYYLYFHEKILGSLIGDPTFVLPFWNWDSLAGMRMPSMYAQPGSSLYDELRDAEHQPPYLLDLNYNLVDSNLPATVQYNRNLTTMYRQVVSGAKTSKLLLGSPYRAGGAANPGGGTIENVPHGPVHIWSGDRTQTNFENMGNLYSAARDPIFYAHSNCDRIWTIWKSLGGNRKDFTDPDFLNASFLFYDENKQLVRVMVLYYNVADDLNIKDCLEQENLRYKYKDVEIPWMQTKPKTPKESKVKKRIAKKKSEGATEFPIILDKTVEIWVKRPKKKSRSKKEKEDKEEILNISGIELEKGAFVKFDVFINDEDEVGPESSEFVGSFTNTWLKLGITDTLEDLDAEDDDYVLVTIIPRDSGRGKEVVTIQGIEIQFD